KSTGVDGVARVGSWTLGSVAGLNAMTATSAGLTGSPVTFNATGLVGSATQLFVAQQPSSNAQSGIVLSQQPRVQLRDGSGNPVAQSGVSVLAAISSGPGGTLGGTTTATTDGTGLATFTTLVISGPVGTYALGFTAGGLSGA